MQTSFLPYIYIWLTIIVCLATCNYDLVNGVNPFDTNFFKVKRKNSKSFLPQFNPLNRPFDTNLSNSDIQLHLMNSNLDKFNHNNVNKNHNIDTFKGLNSQLTASSESFTTSRNSFSINQQHQQQKTPINDKDRFVFQKQLEKQAIETYAQQLTNNHQFNQISHKSFQSLTCEPKTFPQYVENR